jgi:hypothetical protein
MILRIDLILWGLAAVIAIAESAWRLRFVTAGAARRQLAGQMVLSGCALGTLLAGLLWYRALAGGRPDAGAATSLACMAGGAIVCGLWQDWRAARDLPAGAARDQAGPHALALSGAGLLLVAAIVTGWVYPTAVAGLPADTWPSALRNIVTGLGLGGWLFIGAGASYAGAAHVWRRVRRKRAVDTRLAAGPEAQGTGGGDNGAAMAGPRRLESIVRHAGHPAPATDGAGNLSAAALRFSYPWLTAALIGSGIWSLAVYATFWRGRPSELWLVVAWLIGGAYLHAVAGHRTPRLARGWASLLAVFGLLAALLAAWQLPTLFT